MLFPTWHSRNTWSGRKGPHALSSPRRVVYTPTTVLSGAGGDFQRNAKRKEFRIAYTHKVALIPFVG
jgi:hypothetical protein